MALVLGAIVASDVGDHFMQFVVGVLVAIFTGSWFFN